MRTRDWIRSWLVAALTWVVGILLSSRMYGSTLEGRDIEGGILVSLATVLLLPVLSAALATVLLPVPARGAVGPWMLAGVPVPVVATVISLVRGVAQGRPLGDVGLMPLVLVALAAGASLLTGWLKARYARAAPVAPDGRGYGAGARSRG